MPDPPPPTATTAPILSTPDTHIFEDPTPPVIQTAPRYGDAELFEVYEIERTARELRRGGWRKVALQFPDEMLRDAGRVVEGLERELRDGTEEKGEGDERRRREEGERMGADKEEMEVDVTRMDTESKLEARNPTKVSQKHERESRHRLHILADTSYGACCVDEIAAEHVSAEVVVHYGRSCLSPVARLPVIYVFTSRPLDIERVIAAFENTYPDKKQKVVIVADVTYHAHTKGVGERLGELGYENLLMPGIVHDPGSLIPNRDIGDNVTAEELKTYSLFYISQPLPALLLTLSSRVGDMYIYPTTNITTTSSSAPSTLKTNTTLSLRRRYALLTSLTTCSIFGILINTLSVKNYLSTVTSLQAQIARAGKKSYTFVVGKVNAAKVANFAEVGGWVVVGCWESSLLESGEFYRPVVTPFELGLALQGDGERVWSGEWRGDFEGFGEVNEGGGGGEVRGKKREEGMKMGNEEEETVDGGDLDSEEESEPPEFDLRTGRYVSHTQPMQQAAPIQNPEVVAGTEGEDNVSSKVLARRAKGDLVAVNGVASPGAEYLRSQRTWTGLGSDFVESEGSSIVEEGRRGVARGYTVGEEGERR